MVNIVVVSHSHALATAAVDLARQMQTGATTPQVAVAAGVDEHTFGTDATRIHAAIEEVDSPDGVLVLMDVGSAVLSAEMAVEMLDPQVGSRVRLCPAPLVEGLIVAMVAAAGGASLAQVADEAAAALQGKHSQLGSTASPEVARSTESPPDSPVESPPQASAVFTLENTHGLHARPAALLVAEVRTFAAEVWLRNRTTGAGPVAATSLSQVATLGARQGHEIEVSADGAQARDAVDHVLALAARQFDEADEAPVRAGPSAVPQPAAPPSTGPLAASPGIAIGPVWRPEPATLYLPEQPAGDPASEWRRLQEAVTAVRDEVARARDRTTQDVGAAQAAIFDAHLLLLDDAALLDEVRGGIEDGRAAEVAWARPLAALEERMASLDDEYQRARAVDVQAIREQVLRALLGVDAELASREGVLVAVDLTPAEASALDAAVVSGVVLARGSPAAHAAILARTRGLPMVVAAGADLLQVPEGTMVAFDGGTGELVVDPDDSELERFRQRAADHDRVRAQARERADEPAWTRDGVAVEVAANIGSSADAALARAAGADSAGLVRTEFLFLDRAEPPDVAEQVRVYRELAEALGGRRLTLRTLDVGGDKPLPYLPVAEEANPFLGVRGIRLSLARHDLLRDQLTAAVEVAWQSPVSIMFPMVSTVEEVQSARALLDEVLAARGTPPGLKVGIMVEVPAAALKSAAFMPYVDFFSIGTNDLTQYALAAERGNTSVAALADPWDPGVLRLIDEVCTGADDQVRVVVCGELASDPQAVPLLVGLGVRELSVVPPAVPAVKQAVRQVDVADAAKQAKQALVESGAPQVRALVSGGAEGR